MPQRMVGEHVLIDGDRPFIVPQADGGRGRKRAIVGVLRVDGQQGVDLHRRPHVFLALDQRFGIVVARRPIAGFQHQDGFEQGFGVVEDVAGQADARQQAHGFRMVAVFQEKGADDVLGRLQIAVGKQAGRGHHLGRQGLQRRDVIGRQAGVGQVAGQAVEAFEHRPCGRQGGIDMHGAQQGVDRVRRVFSLDVAETAFLVQAAEGGLGLFQAVQHRKGFVDATQMAQSGRGDQQHVAVFRKDGEPRGGAVERLCVLALPLQGFQAGDFRLDGRGFGR